MAGRRPLVKSNKTIRVNNTLGLNHIRGQPKNIATPIRIAASTRKSSFVSKKNGPKYIFSL